MPTQKKTAAQKDKDRWMTSACKSIFEQIHRTWGNGWKMLGDDLKRAIVAERVLYIFTGLDDSAQITPEKITEYLNAMNHYCGLDQDEE